MNEHPILFSNEMVKAIREGRKTQTRRVMKFQPESGEKVYGPELYNPIILDKNGEEQPGKEIFGVYGYDWGLKCPYGMPGDKLWVKETYMPLIGRNLQPTNQIVYKADGWESNDKEYKVQWKSSRFMPKVAARLWLEIVNVRVQQVQDISEEDAISEGVKAIAYGPRIYPSVRAALDSYRYKNGFQKVWDQINSKRGFGWDVNPWVWVIEFKVVE